MYLEDIVYILMCLLVAGSIYTSQRRVSDTVNVRLTQTVYYTHPVRNSPGDSIAMVRVQGGSNDREDLINDRSIAQLSTCNSICKTRVIQRNITHRDTRPSRIKRRRIRSARTQERSDIR